MGPKGEIDVVECGNNGQAMNWSRDEHRQQPPQGFTTLATGKT